ncbi:MAG TPA: di-heme oxidoredictase family protein [Kofleriaceae bacterium]|nr:di-heme oxidoredictase family protein [Kofleriaceae bacterium]
MLVTGLAVGGCTASADDGQVAAEEQATADQAASDQALSADAFFDPGQPLPGITSADFATVSAAFATVETPADGVGPIFNETACGNCHKNGALGGGGDNIERRFGKFDNNGTSFNPLGAEGGTLRALLSLGSFTNGTQACNVPLEVTPPDATVVDVGRLAPQLFGLGLVESLPDSFFQNLVAAEPAATRGVLVMSPLALANPDDPSEITGALHVNRFGLKSQIPSLIQFAANAYQNELGITTQHCVRGQSVTAFCAEQLPNNKPLPAGCDDLAPPQPADVVAATGCPANTDDVVGSCANGLSKIQDDIANFTTFATFLSPPPPDVFNTSLVGAALFSVIGCANCHVDSLVSPGALGSAATFKTPPNPAGIRAADGVLRAVPGNFTFHPFSDFATHDMGKLGDGLGNNAGDTQRQARSMRTAPLWGIRFRHLLLHDGRTSDIATAISAHDGEGAQAAALFNLLPADYKAELVKFVHSL